MSLFRKKSPPQPDLRPAAPLELLSFDELLSMKLKIESLIGPRVHEEMAALKMRLASLVQTYGGSSSDNGAKPDKKKRRAMTARQRYINPGNANETYSGRGKRPQWLQNRLDSGASLNEFAVQDADD